MKKPSPSQICLYKSLLRHPFNPSPKPTSPFPLSPIQTQLGPNSVPSPPNPNSLSYPTQTHFTTHLTRASYTTESSVAELDKNREVDMINLKFAEAREEIEMAMESKETVYFDEEAELARAAVNQVLDRFEGLLKKLPETEKAALQRSMGLKIEQLKAELQQLND